ncbi:MAG: hypothetical protein H0W41_07860 [Chloroflexi bacterium]|nr:hypothetical protein [Chloroflexota bacterium]
MQRLKFVFSRRRQGHPTPTWRRAPSDLPIDVRLSAPSTHEPHTHPAERAENADGRPRPRAHRPIWER